MNFSIYPNYSSIVGVNPLKSATRGKIDWTRDKEFLDKELQKVVRDAELGRRLADKLVKIWRPGGSLAWVLIHVEVQSQEETNFSLADESLPLPHL